MHVYNTHLNLHDTGERHNQMNIVGASARSWSLNHNPRTILGGDFNEQAHSANLTRYMSNRDLAYSAPECGRTLDISDYSNNCIDHWYVWQNGMNHGTNRIVPSKKYGYVDPPAGSDHWPVALNVSYK